MEEPTAKLPKTNAKPSAQRKESEGKTDRQRKYSRQKSVHDTRKSESISLIVRKNGFYGSRAKNGKGQILVREVHPDHVGDIREGDILVSLNGVDVSGHTNQQFQLFQLAVANVDMETTVFIELSEAKRQKITDQRETERARQQHAYMSQGSIDDHRKRNQHAYMSQEGVDDHRKRNQHAYMSQEGVDSHRKRNQHAYMSQEGVDSHRKRNQHAYMSQGSVDLKRQRDKDAMEAHRDAGQADRLRPFVQLQAHYAERLAASIATRGALPREQFSLQANNTPANHLRIAQAYASDFASFQLPAEYCRVCDERWFHQDMAKNDRSGHLKGIWCCKRCRDEKVNASVKGAVKIHTWSKQNGMDPSVPPPCLARLSLLERMLISIIVPCIQVSLTMARTFARLV